MQFGPTSNILREEAQDLDNQLRPFLKKILSLEGDAFQKYYDRNLFATPRAETKDIIKENKTKIGKFKPHLRLEAINQRKVAIQQKREELIKRREHMEGEFVETMKQIRQRRKEKDTTCLPDEMHVKTLRMSKVIQRNWRRFLIMHLVMHQIDKVYRVRAASTFFRPPTVPIFVLS